MASNQGRVTKPYRKASEYLHSAQKQSVPGGAPVRQLQRSNEPQHQSQTELMLTRKLERAEAEYAQSREYWENQLDLSHDRELKISEQYKRLQSSYAALQATNKELEDKVSKINRLEAERDAKIKEINELTNKVTETRNSLLKAQDENERLRKDCNIAVQLLKCNQSSYQVQRTEQLPENIQERVNSYKVELQDYNEYINPYAEGESDSESDGGITQNRLTESKTGSSGIPQQRMQQNSNSIPIEFLAEALKKPENVHMNLEASDYVQDPSLHSVYKAQYLDKKLIKPDYAQEQREANLPRYRAPPALSNPKPRSSSRPPVSNMQPVKGSAASEESSPWQLAPSRTGLPSYNEEVDDGSSAGAYGAYSVGPKRRVPRRHLETYPEQNKNRHIEVPKTSIPKLQQEYEKPKLGETYQKRSESFSAAVRPASPDNLEFRSSTVQSCGHSGVSSYFSRSTKSSPSIKSSSNSSSQKSTPLKVRGKESATTAETSSLLHQSASDEEDYPLDASLYSSKQSSPDKTYLKKENTNMEEGGSLLKREDDEEESIPPECGEIDLEWEVEIPTEDLTEIPEVNNSEIVQDKDKTPKTQGPEPDLLLSYKPIESPAKSSIADLEDLVLSTPEHMRLSSDDGLSLLESQQHLPPPNPNGQLLSEIVTNNPSLSNFLMAQPPPPPQFSSTNEASEVALSIHPYNSSIPPLYSNALASTESSSMSPPSNNIPDSIPIRVDEQVEVIDLDEEPRKRVNRRRNSFDQAQEFGNILNL